MSEETKIIQPQEEMWAILELMGHGQTAGKVEKPGEWGGLIRVDVPTDDGGYRTEFYGMSSIYSIKFVSEEIARAYAPRDREITAYDSPIVTRDQHYKAVRQLEGDNRLLQSKINELERRLTAIKALPAGHGQSSGDFDDDEPPEQTEIPF